MPNDNKKFLANYNKYIDKIYTYIWYRVAFDKTVAEDLCSEIFLKAFKNYDSFYYLYFCCIGSSIQKYKIVIISLSVFANSG